MSTKDQFIDAITAFQRETSLDLRICPQSMIGKMTFQVHPDKWVEAAKSEDYPIFFNFDIRDGKRFLAHGFEVQKNLMVPKDKVRFGIMIEL